MALNEKQILEKVNSQFVVSIVWAPWFPAHLLSAVLVEFSASSISCSWEGARSWIPLLCTLALLPVPLLSLILGSGPSEVQQSRGLCLPWERDVFYSLGLHHSWSGWAILIQRDYLNSQALGGRLREIQPKQIRWDCLAEASKQWGGAGWPDAGLSWVTPALVPPLKLPLDLEKEKKKGVISASVMFFILISGNTVYTTDARCLLTCLLASARGWHIFKSDG